MTAPTASRRPLRATQPGLRRGSLTPERIVDASLELLDKQGVAGFSLPKLGRGLGRGPDRGLPSLREQGRHGPRDRRPADRRGDGGHGTPGLLGRYGDRGHQAAPHRLPRPPSRSLAVREPYHPGAQRDAGRQFPHRRRARGRLFEGAEAVRIYRALGDFSLFWAGGEAAGFLALDERAQATERAAWAAYLAVERAEFPHIWQVRLELPEVADDAIFDTILSLVIGGLMQRAPRPCGCGAHPVHPGFPA